MRPRIQVRPRHGRGKPLERAVRGRHAELRMKRPAWVGLVPIPDSGFVRKLREFDPDLSVEFDRFLGKFVIYQQGRISGKTLAMVVDGDLNRAGFRYPDERDLGRLKAVDMHNERVRRHIIDEREQELREQPMKEYEAGRQELHEASLDDKHQIKHAYRKMLNDGKVAPHVRSVTPKPRGKVF